MRNLIFIGSLLSLVLGFVSCSQNYSNDKADKALSKRNLSAVLSVLNKRQVEPGPNRVLAASQKGLDGIELAVPQGWEKVRPSSSMRVAEYRISGARPQDGKATLAVFAGKMGTVEANVSRWIGQFTQPDGSSTHDKAKRWEEMVDGMRVVFVDVPGTYAPNMGMQQGADTAPAPRFRMLGAIVDYGSKFYYFKLIGPRDTVAIWTLDFEKFIGDIRRT
jgi:hypothetical protein